MKATTDQIEALEAIRAWLKNGKEPYITLGGYAGTGKTTIVAMLAKLVHQLAPKARIAYCAYTGKASRVLDMSLRVNLGKKEKQVSTIHSLIYAPVTNAAGQVTSWRRKSKLEADLIVVDEASMVDASIWQDLLDYEIPIIAVGDHGQLPPVNSPFNLMEHPMITLTTIHRQAQDNPIIQVSIMAREKGVIPVKTFGPGVKKLDRFDAMNREVIDALLHEQTDEMMILCGYNHTRVKLNEAIRMYRDLPAEKPVKGDKVICLRNNWEKGVYNGMVGIVEKLVPIADKTDGEVHWYGAEIEMVDEPVTYNGIISVHQFGQAKTLSSYQGISAKALGDVFDYGYALTVHKAQGSQAKCVLLFEERNKHMSDDDWRRWLYTGVTRAEEELTIVGS